MGVGVGRDAGGGVGAGVGRDADGGVGAGAIGDVWPGGDGGGDVGLDVDAGGIVDRVDDVEADPVPADDIEPSDPVEAGLVIDP